MAYGHEPGCTCCGACARETPSGDALTGSPQDQNCICGLGVSDKRGGKMVVVQPNPNCKAH